MTKNPVWLLSVHPLKSTGPSWARTLGLVIDMNEIQTQPSTNPGNAFSKVFV